MTDTPALSGRDAPPLKCGRILSGLNTPDEVVCGRDATWHVIWETDGENGLACDEHYVFIQRNWNFWTSHEYKMECSMPGSRLCVTPTRESWCEVDLDEVGLPTA